MLFFEEESVERISSLPPDCLVNHDLDGEFGAIIEIQAKGAPDRA